MSSVWDLIKLGNFEEACALADAEFKENGNIFPLRNKISALLQLNKFDECIRLSEQIISSNDGSTDSDFIFLGVAHWSKGQRDLAVKAWKSGLHTQYADAAGGVEVPLLLLFAAAITQDKILEKEALSLLKKASKSKRMINWPGPLADYMLGKISEETLRSLVDAQPILFEKQTCQADFFVAISRFLSGDKKAFQDGLTACAKSSPYCYLEAELYLAKAELEKVGAVVSQ
jgi:tetratricopeptide (TPR) repeat protein